MGTASAELRAATEAPTANGPGGADDLLSQMAGEEIKRLLAHSELEANSDAVLPQLMPDPLLEIMDLLPEPPMPAITAKELDEVFVGQVAMPSRDMVRDARDDAISADGVSDLLGSLSAVDDGEEDDDGEQVAARERAALVEPPTEIPEIRPEPRAGTSSVWATRLLDWITLPLDPFPDRVREIIGKIAIVTLINAVVVLVYLKVFR